MGTIKYLAKQWWFWVIIAIVVILVAVKKHKDKNAYQKQLSWLKGVKNQMDQELKALVDSEGGLEIWYRPPSTVEEVDALDTLLYTEDPGNTTMPHIIIEEPEDIDSLTPIELAVLYTAYLDLDKSGYRWVRNIVGSGAVRGETMDQAFVHSLNYWAKQKGLWYHV